MASPGNQHCASCIGTLSSVSARIINTYGCHKFCYCWRHLTNEIKVASVSYAPFALDAVFSSYYADTHGRNLPGVRGSGPPPKKKIGRTPPTFYVIFVGGLVGVTDCAKLGIGPTFPFFLEKGSNTTDQEIGRPNFKNVVALL